MARRLVSARCRREMRRWARPHGRINWQLLYAVLFLCGFWAGLVAWFFHKSPWIV